MQLGSSNLPSLSNHRAIRNKENKTNNAYVWDIRILIFTKTELTEGWVMRLIWSSIPSDFSENFPGAGEVDLKQVYRHTLGPILRWPLLQAFNSFLDEGDVTSIRKISRILLNQSAFSKKRALIRSSIWSMFWFSERKSWYDLLEVGRFDLLWEVDLIEENDAVCCLERFQGSWRSWSVKGSLALRTRRTRSASFEGLFFDRSTPICSTMSSVPRIPAVSTSLRGTPLMLTYSSITSRVVPSISVTMAFSSRRRLLRELDLPTFGRLDDSSRDPFTQDLTATGSLEEVGQEGFKFSGLFTDDFSGCFFDIIVLRIVDIDFDLGWGIEDLLACCWSDQTGEPSSCFTAMFIALSVLARIISHDGFGLG